MPYVTILEQTEDVTATFTKKLTADSIWGIPSTIRLRIVCFLVPKLKASKLIYTKLYVYLLFVWLCYLSL
jgi:hypothetical protein